MRISICATGDCDSQRRYGQCATPTQGTRLRSIWRHFLWPDSVGVRKRNIDLLVNATARFSAAIGQQLVIVQNDPAPADFAEKTVAYAEAKVAYFTALRDEMPELINIASGKEPRPLQLDRFAGAFSVAGEKQKKAADEKTLVFLGRFSDNPDIEKARAEFERAQKIEETFHKDFDGIDFTRRSIGGLIGV